MPNELGTYDLIVSLSAASILPLIIGLNLRERSAPSTPMSAYLWGQQPTLSLTGLAFLAVLAVFSWLELAVHFGFMAPALQEWLLPVIGVPMVIMAFAVLVLTAHAVYRSLRHNPTTR